MVFARFNRGAARTGNADTRRRSRHRGRGQSLVEFAVVFPIFMLVLSGILDFGFMLYSRMTVISAAREGARAVIADTTAGDATTISQVPNKVSSTVLALASGLTAADISTTTTCILPGSGSCYYSAGTPRAATGDWVNVRVTYTYRSFFPLLFGTTFNLTSTVQMLLE